MVSKTARIPRALFPALLASRYRIHGNFVTVVMSEGSFRVSVVVGKKVFKSAVDRNRLRRQVYGVVDRVAKTMKFNKSFIILLKPAAKSATKKALAQEIEEMLARTVNSR